MNKELQLIKKHYSEQLMKICREYFPEILENNGLLTKILKENFYPHKCLGDDILKSNNKYSFINYINSIYNKNNEVKQNIVTTPTKSVAEILKKENYSIYKCQTNDDLNSFAKYYENGEMLCSFKSDRLQNSDIFFLIKDNYKDITRSNVPSREDSYSTSVLCVQFTKGSVNNVSIISRYNHSVSNPNFVYKNNLDNIAEKLSDAFVHEYKYNLSISKSNNFFLEDYIKINNIYYKYNLEINGIYFCLDNIVIKHGKVIEYDKSNYLLVENYLFNLKDRYIESLSNRDTAFPSAFSNISKIKITNEKDKYSSKNKKITIYESEYNEPSIILLNDRNEIILVDMPNLKYTGNNFLFYSKKIETITLKNVEVVLEHFLYNSENLSDIEMPNLKKVGDYFLTNNENIFDINFPNLEHVGEYFLYYNENIETVNLPLLETTKSGFITHNKGLIDINLPNLKIAGDEFLSHSNIKYFKANNLTKIRDNFLQNNKVIQKIELPNVEVIGNDFLSYNKIINKIKLPLCKEVGTSFMQYNIKLNNYDLPNLRKSGFCGMINNPYISLDTIIRRNQRRILLKEYLKLELIKLQCNNLPYINKIFPKINKK